MKLRLLCLFLLLYLLPGAQKLQTIVPDEPVVVGTAFQVQYVLTGDKLPDRMEPPLFGGFRLVSGPHTYTGRTTSDEGSQAVRNITYTLVPLEKGTIPVEGIIAYYDGTVL